MMATKTSSIKPFTQSNIQVGKSGVSNPTIIQTGPAPYWTPGQYQPLNYVKQQYLGVAPGIRADSTPPPNTQIFMPGNTPAIAKPPPVSHAQPIKNQWTPGALLADPWHYYGPSTMAPAGNAMKGYATFS